MSDKALPGVKPCRGCQAGQLQLQYVTYFTWLADELITVPNFPAWICDVCGRREYDTHAISQLNLLLNPNAGKKPVYKPAGSAQRNNKNQRSLSQD